MRLLVIGARPRSLGDMVAAQATMVGYTVTTAGLMGEDVSCDVTSTRSVHDLMQLVRPHHVVSTVGRNMPGTIQGQGWFAAMREQMDVNYIGQMIVLSEWCRYWRDHFLKVGPERMEKEWGGMVLHCVAISSNSAQVARSKSGGYCASKAALSMGYRCAAREQAEHPFAIYTYEPGWIGGTPMSQEVEARVRKDHNRDGMFAPDDNFALHRIPGGNIVNPDELASLIVSNLSLGRWLNGTTLRVDGGDQ